jgi:hypothetical protein
MRRLGCMRPSRRSTAYWRASRRMGSINSILQNGLDRQPLARASPAPGSRYYH